MSLTKATRPTETLIPQKTFFAFLHFYQPQRSVFRPDTKSISIVPIINEKIYKQCYQPLLDYGDALRPGVAFSLYSSLRHWIAKNHPTNWEKIKKNIKNLEDKEYQVVADPLIHAIIPLLNDDDKRILIQAGRNIFKKDFGFNAKGIWLPEGAVNTDTLRILVEAGYEFVVLKNNQLNNTHHNPVWINLGDGKKIAVVHFNSNTSDIVASQPERTINGDYFLNDFGQNGIAFGTDGETMGHHYKDKDKFIKYITEPRTLEQHGLIPFKIKEALSNHQPSKTTTLKENSSWSCAHGTSRWTGDCNCDGASEATNAKKRNYFQKLNTYNQVINNALNEIFPNWQMEFTNLLVDLGENILNGSDFISSLNNLPNNNLRCLYIAKIYGLLGMTSCGWFFGTTDHTIEQNIPQQSIEIIEALLPSLQPYLK